ncbi:MAG: hemerythrin domain-containing protein [Ilumatobacteraceae bacterium]
MCDYCDCRSHSEIASLSDDHETFGHMLDQLMRAVETDDRHAAAAVAAELHPLLDGHAAREERGVFTQLRHAHVSDGYVARFERDHQAVHALLDDRDERGWHERARELIHVLGDHIAREESDLFPAAHQLLTPAQWDAVDAASAVGAHAA